MVSLIMLERVYEEEFLPERALHEKENSQRQTQIRGIVVEGEQAVGKPSIAGRERIPARLYQLCQRVDQRTHAVRIAFCRRSRCTALSLILLKARFSRFPRWFNYGECFDFLCFFHSSRDLRFKV